MRRIERMVDDWEEVGVIGVVFDKQRGALDVFWSRLRRTSGFDRRLANVLMHEWRVFCGVCDHAPA